MTLYTRSPTSPTDLTGITLENRNTVNNQNEISFCTEIGWVILRLFGASTVCWTDAAEQMLNRQGAATGACMGTCNHVNITRNVSKLSPKKTLERFRSALWLDTKKQTTKCLWQAALVAVLRQSFCETILVKLTSPQCRPVVYPMTWPIDVFL